MGGVVDWVTPLGPVEVNRVVRACIHAARKLLDGITDRQTHILCIIVRFD